MNDNEKVEKIICFRYLGNVFLYIEITKGFDRLKEFAENYEINHIGEIYLSDDGDYFYVDFEHPDYVEKLIKELEDYF